MIHHPQLPPEHPRCTRDVAIVLVVIVALFAANHWLTVATRDPDRRGSAVFGQSPQPKGEFAP